MPTITLQGLPLIKISIRHFQNTPESLFTTDFYTQQSRDNRVMLGIHIVNITQKPSRWNYIKSTVNFSVFQHGEFVYI